MSRIAQIILLSALPVIVFGQSNPKAAPVNVATVVVKGPLIVGFFPPVTQAEMEDPNTGTSEGIAHVRFALEDTLKCLKASGVSATAQLELATTLIVMDKGKTRRILLPTSWPGAAGAYLFMPGKEPQAVFAQAGPSSLVVLVPKAAAHFYAASACTSE